MNLYIINVSSWDQLKQLIDKDYGPSWNQMTEAGIILPKVYKETKRKGPLHIYFDCLKHCHQLTSDNELMINKRIIFTRLLKNNQH